MALPRNPNNPFGLPNLVPPPPPRPPTAKVTQAAPAQSFVKYHGEGLVVRFSPIHGVTPRAVLNKRFWLPCVLNNWQLAETAGHTEYDTLAGGQFSEPQQGPSTARKLRTTSFESLTVDADTPWYVVIGQNPLEIRTLLYNILRARKPVHMLLYFMPHPGTHSELEMDVTFRALTRELRPAERDTRYFTLQITEWRDASVQRRGSSGGGRKMGVTLPATHVLKATDTLYSLSMEYYGNYLWWREIRDANGIPKRWGGKTPLVGLHGRFTVGAKITIPLVTEATSHKHQADARVHTRQRAV